MRMNILGIETSFEFNDSSNSMLVIKNKKLYTSIITKLLLLSEGELSSNDVIVLDDKMKNVKNMEIIIDPFRIDYNSKRIITNLYKLIEKNIIYENMHTYSELTSKVTSFLQDYFLEFNMDFEYKIDIPVSAYLKTIDLKFAKNDDEKLITKIINYIEVISELSSSTVLVFIGILSYLDLDEIGELMKYKNYKHINIFFIENKELDDYNDIRTYVIDDDLYEYTT